MNKFKWPLNINNATWLDRLRICSFILNPNNRWTADRYVSKFEEEMAAFVGVKYAVFTSSGSSANSILAAYLKDKIIKEKSSRHIVVLPSTTWQTACSPYIREGFIPHFIDVNLNNFSMDLLLLANYLNANHEKVACVFITSLLGFNPDISKILELQGIFHEITFYIDNCEHNFGHFDARNIKSPFVITSTTSTYFGHMLSSIEGGFIFTNNLEEYEKFLMYRNHGMTRTLPNESREKYTNPKVDSRFDFYCLGNNYRNSDLNAFIGLLDFNKRFAYIKKRRELYGVFQYNLNRDRYVLPEDSVQKNLSWFVPFCLPVIAIGSNAGKRIKLAKIYCIENGIETRPIISGFLGHQTAYRNLLNEKDHSISVYLHENGFYVGLYSKLKKRNIFKLVNYLNKI
ncbi:MAG: DegT/DnrJ/EryC1/StrS family aminotransferase [Nanoarchaeota archaeon]